MASYSVSIPAGFSDALRPHKILLTGTPVLVSIPAGFSDALRHGRMSASKLLLRLFQSLLGFLMRCDSSQRVPP